METSLWISQSVRASLHRFGFTTQQVGRLAKFLTNPTLCVCLPLSCQQTKVLPGRVISWEPITAWCPSAAASQPTVPCWPSAFRRWWPCGVRPPGSSWRLCRSHQKPSGQSACTHIHSGSLLIVFNLMDLIVSIMFLVAFNIITLSGDCTEAVNRMVSRQSWWCSSCRVLLQPSYNLVIAATSDLGTVDKKRK